MILPCSFYRYKKKRCLEIGALERSLVRNYQVRQITLVVGFENGELRIHVHYLPVHLFDRELYNFFFHRELLANC